KILDVSDLPILCSNAILDQFAGAAEVGIAAAFSGRLRHVHRRDVARKDGKRSRAPKSRSIPIHWPAEILVILLFELARNRFVRVDGRTVLNLLFGQTDVYVLCSIVD